MSKDAARLFVALGRINRAVRRDAPDAVLGPGALSALATLVRGGPARLGMLARTEGVSPPSMTRIVAFLEEQGLVQRSQDASDGRVYLVEATGAGVELVESGRSRRLAALAARIERLPDEERERITAALPALESLADD